MVRTSWLLMLVVCLVSNSAIDCDAQKVDDDNNDEAGGGSRLISDPSAYQKEVMGEQKLVVDSLANDDIENSYFTGEAVLGEKGSGVTQNAVMPHTSPASKPANLTKSRLDLEDNKGLNSEEHEDFGEGQQLMGPSSSEITSPLGKSKMDHPSWMNRVKEQGQLNKFPSLIPSFEYLDPRVNYELPDLFHFKHIHSGSKHTLMLIKEVPESVVPVESIQLLGQRAIWKLSKEDVVERFRGIDTGDENVIVNFNGYIITKLIDGFPRRFLVFLYNVGNKTFALEPHEMYMHDSLEKFEAPGFEDPESVNFNRMNHLIFDVTKSLIPEDEVNIKIVMPVMGDYSMFENALLLERNFSSENVQNASDKVHFYVWHVGKKTAKSFESIRSKHLKVTLDVVGTIVAETPEESDFIETSKLGPGVIDGDAALKKYESTTLQGKEQEEGKYVGVVLTRYQIMSNGNVVRGVSSSQNLCSPGFIILNDKEFHTSSNVLSKHVALTIGIGYDGEQNTCHPSEGFVMSKDQTVADLNTTEYFSSCASEYLKKALEEMKNYGKNCFKEGVDFGNVGWKNPFTGYQPGEVYDVNKQCQLVFGRGYIFEWPESTGKMCEVVTCRNLSGNDTKSLPLMRALQGTSCRDGAWCMDNFCTDDIRAPTVLQRVRLISDDSDGTKEKGPQHLSVNLRLASFNLAVSLSILMLLIFLVFWSKSKWSKFHQLIQTSRLVEEGQFPDLKKDIERKVD